VDAERRRDPFRELEEAYRDYTVYDQHYERVGKVDDLFVDENDQPEYIGVRTGFLESKFALIPMEIARINDRRRLIEVAADKDTIRSAPAFDENEEITYEHEARIYGYFGLEHPGFAQGRGVYGDYYPSDTAGEAYTGEDLADSVDTEYGERREESLERSTEETTFGEERYDTSSHADETDRDYPPTEPRDDPGAADEPARTGEAQQSGAGETGRVRVHKRGRTSRE
jgi:PRC-barrel domain